MSVGSPGLFYCSDTQIFTTPFVVESEPEDCSISNVWENTWYLPFTIRPLGDLANSVSWNRATVNWPFLRDSDNRAVGHPDMSEFWKSTDRAESVAEVRLGRVA